MDDIGNIVSKQDWILVTGGNGFIGSHVALKLHEHGYRVRVADNVPTSAHDKEICSETVVGNLCDIGFCHRIVQGVKLCFHFAATMGGMGVIHEANDFEFYKLNHLMTSNILECCLHYGVCKRFFYASSACVYPSVFQGANDADRRLAETDAWESLPPSPQGLYGLEKLVSECLLEQYRKGDMEIRIARFHNVFGPRGSWNNGFEKAPAAMLRKALASRGFDKVNFEIWGDGSARRSFLFIDDAVDGVLSLLTSPCQAVCNIGSEEAVSVKELAEMALKVADVDKEKVQFVYDTTKPVGVAARNSNNDFVQKELGWCPSFSLEEGLSSTAVWMSQQIEKITAPLSDQDKIATLESFQKSSLIDLKSSRTKIAILLPITSRGSNPPEAVLDNLRVFARSLFQTTWREVNAPGEDLCSINVYVAVDFDDVLFCDNGNRAVEVLMDEGIYNIKCQTCKHPRGHICALWRDCARSAWKDGCDYYVLMGDDVVIKDAGWVTAMRNEFKRISEEKKVPFGIGCVAFTDEAFDGFPTFPIISKLHMDIFSGEVIPEGFVNQDGDPYLYQIYRRWDSSVFLKHRLNNTIGGEVVARYDKSSAMDWTFGILHDGVDAVEKWLKQHDCQTPKKLMLDVVVPSYRVNIQFFDNLFNNIHPSDDCLTCFNVVIDNPKADFTSVLLSKYNKRPDNRIRVHDKNMGCSHARNRGLAESSADWVLLMDDDVIPDPNVLKEAENMIKRYPSAAGFICNHHLPVADSIFTTAVQMSEVAFLWNMASRVSEDVPWGATALLLVKRIKDGVSFNTEVFPKTGGGEDIDYCLRKRDAIVREGGEGFRSAQTVSALHPWWNDGIRSYWRFYMWAKGDGGLVRLHPQYCYLDLPSAPEAILFLLIFVLILLPNAIVEMTLRSLKVPLVAIVSVMLGHLIHDVYRILISEKDKYLKIDSNVSGMRWVVAAFESTLIRTFSETGRLVGMLERREYGQLCNRFEWFCGRRGDAPIQEGRKLSAERLSCSVVVMAIALVLF